jgi:hypothetical protein
VKNHVAPGIFGLRYAVIAFGTRPRFDFSSMGLAINEVSIDAVRKLTTSYDLLSPPRPSPKGREIQG